MVTSRLALTCCKLVSHLHTCRDKFAESLQICSANLLQTEIAIWEGMFFEHTTLIVVVVHFSLKMSKYSVSERISIVKAYYSRNNSPIAAQRKFATEYKLKTAAPSVITIKNVIEKFERTGSVDVSTHQRFLQNFALLLRYVIAIDGKHIEPVIN
ncbi:hypothetical protein AVEN_246020-1 [Araneus ventricosus]|uniref:DUF4817 domain-containing protein n=1 Tax=Araneus ventricosus TaxID=182803 RepID=A0A4Y2B9P9_ARAVE|nr:hypothetical protein AVEN_246020-1 [Araneus ventricosus]